MSFSLLLTGCGSKSDEEEPSPQEATQPEASTEPSPENVEASDAKVATDKVMNVYVVSTNKDGYVVEMRDNAVKALENAGFKDGQNMKLTLINLEGDFSKCPKIIEEIKAANPDVVIQDCSNGNAIDGIVNLWQELRFQSLCACRLRMNNMVLLRALKNQARILPA
jgi:ABC-type branched-subunit amino acid transport system substrate-binding protein